MRVLFKKRRYEFLRIQVKFQTPVNDSTCKRKGKMTYESISLMQNIPVFIAQYKTNIFLWNSKYRRTLKNFKCKTLKTIYSSVSMWWPKRCFLDHVIEILRICILTKDHYFINLNYTNNGSGENNALFAGAVLATKILLVTVVLQSSRFLFYLKFSSLPEPVQ